MKHKPYLLALALCVATSIAFAEPAYTGLRAYTQPDGTAITLSLQGDEWLQWALSTDGYTLLSGKDGFWEYAVVNKAGDLVPSGVRANNEAQRSSEEKNLLTTIPKDLWFSPSQLQAVEDFKAANCAAQEVQRSLWGGGNTDAPQRKATDVTPKLGVRRMPVILVGFPNMPFNKTREEYIPLFTELNSTATSEGWIPGSVRDYFRDVSHGQLNMEFDLFGPYTLSEHSDFYNYHRTPQGNPRAMVYEAVMMAREQDGLNMANYDGNDDGFIDGVYILFAGHAQNHTGSTDNLWSHAWNMPGEYANMEIDGKKFGWYGCSPELRGGSGTNLTNIGVVIHEMGHMFGFPDYAAGTTVTAGNWCIMATGSHVDNGRTPPKFSAHLRHMMGWLSPTDLIHPGPYTLPDPEEQDKLYRIYTRNADGSSNTDEYFLMENRQRVGWDAHVPSSGMLIFHYDASRPHGVFSGPNGNAEHRGYYIKQAGGGLLSNSSSNRQNDPYPATGNTEFTDYSVPNAISWSGTPTRMPITHITLDEDDRVVTFVLRYGEPTITTATLPKGTVGTAYSLNLEAEVTEDVDITWSVASGNMPPGVTLFSNGMLSGMPAVSGTFIFTVKATTAFGEDTQGLSITIDPAPVLPSITTTTLSGGVRDSIYSHTIKATGDATIVWTLESGELPEGLLLEEDGVIAGTPTAIGLFHFTVKAVNEHGSDTKAFSIAIDTTPLPPTIITTTLPDGAETVAYNQVLSATGTSTILWAVESGSLPTGLTLYATGLIEGTPVVADTFRFTVRAFNSTGSTTQALMIVIGDNPYPPDPPLPPTITTTTFPDGMEGIGYAAFLTATGDTTIVWTVESGALPPGLTLYSSGSISGTPTADGAFVFTVKALNNAGSDTRQLLLVVWPNPTTDIVYDKDALVESAQPPPLRAWVANGVLHIKGIPTGNTYRIYTLLGTIIHQGIATEDIVRATLAVARTGTYIIQSGEWSVKMVW